MVSESRMEAGGAASTSASPGKTIAASSIAFASSSSASAQAVGAPKGSVLSAQTYIAPRLVSALILRIGALVKKLLPVEVSADSLQAPDGLINVKVVQSFVRAGGDLADAVPFALLEAKKLFDSAARDAELNKLRSQACEILARRTIYQLLKAREETGNNDGVYLCLSKRFSYIGPDGEETLATSALESAVDQKSVVVLSSPESQTCVEAIWTGRLIQSYAEGHDRVHFVPWRNDVALRGSFWDHFDPNRLAVPRYLYAVSLFAWITLLFVYSAATKTYTGLDGWEIALWVMLGGYILEDLNRWWKVRGLEALSLWLIIDVVQDALAAAAFAVRVVSFVYEDPDHTAKYQRLAFQLLACLAPFLWMQLLKATDVFKFFGLVLQSLVRMLQETGIFLVLLVLVGIGFAQALFSLDAADGGRTENAGHAVLQTLLSGLLGGGQSTDIVEDFGRPFSEILIYTYSLIQSMFLLNILVALLNNAYADICADADDVFAAYFATKCVGLIRAPDQFVYPAPLNLLEAFVIAPLEFVLPRRAYATLNRVVQTILFVVPLTAIAVFESRVAERLFATRSIRLEMLSEMGWQEEDTDAQAMAAAIRCQNAEDPVVVEVEGQGGNGAGAVTISRVSFAQLASTFPAIKGGTEDDSDGDPTTGDVDVDSGAAPAASTRQSSSPAVKAEEDTGNDGQKDEALLAPQELLGQLLHQVKTLRQEVQQLRGNRQGTKAE
ncbi:unnamed protein product [Parajaminaea phylloscopi]